MGSQPAPRAIDWKTAQRIGELVAGSGRHRDSPTGANGRPATRPPADIASERRPGGASAGRGEIADSGYAEELAHDFARRVGEYTGLDLPDELPPLEMVDRPAWIAANLATMRPLLDRVIQELGSDGEDVEESENGDRGESGRPGADGGRSVEDRLGVLAGPARAVSDYLRAASDAASGPLGAASGHLLGAQLGVVTGMLSQRVLGQYDVALLGPDERPPRLLLLEPNLAAAAARLEIDRGELTAWVAIHEITHAVQFAGAPWLRGHLGGMLEELLTDLRSIGRESDLGALLARARRGDMGKLIERARRGELLRLGLGDERWKIVERLQATMSLIEGHAEHTMDAVGAEVLPSLPKLRAAMTRRRESRGLPWRVLERLLGLELKMRQYQVGRRFCDEVVEEGGPQALKIAWHSPQELPSPAELNEPALWLARMRTAA